MRSLNPACKFLGLLVITFVLASRRDPVWNFAVFALCVIVICASRVSFKWLLLLLPVALAAAGMFFTGYRFFRRRVHAGASRCFLVGSSALWNSLLQASRVLAYAGLGYAFALTTDRITLVRSFQKQFHPAPDLRLRTAGGLGVFPQMVQEFRRTKAAFRARGIRVLPVSPALLAPPAGKKSVRWSEELAIAMESKGFAGRQKRTEFAPVHVRARDWSFCSAAACCCRWLPCSLSSTAKMPPDTECSVSGGICCPRTAAADFSGRTQKRRRSHQSASSFGPMEGEEFLTSDSFSAYPAPAAARRKLPPGQSPRC